MLVDWIRRRAYLSLFSGDCFVDLFVLHSGVEGEKTAAKTVEDKQGGTMNFGSIMKKIGQGALIGGKMVLNANPATAMIGPLVDLAENKITGRHQGEAKMDFVLKAIEPALRELDSNDTVEWGVKDWDMLIMAVKRSVTLVVEARKIEALVDKATTWGDGE